MRRRRVRVGLALLAWSLAWFLAVGPGVAGAQADRDCADFTYQEDAQALYDADPSDLHRLDGSDQDGVVCETLPRRGAAGTGSSGSGGSGGATTDSGSTSGEATRGATGASVVPLSTGSAVPLARTGLSAENFGAVAVCLLAAGGYLLLLIPAGRSSG
jgi:hypothetical protein